MKLFISRSNSKEGTREKNVPQRLRLWVPVASRNAVTFRCSPKGDASRGRKISFVSADEPQTLHHGSCKNLVSCTNKRRRAGDHGRCGSRRTDVIGPEGLGTPDLIVPRTSAAHAHTHRHTRGGRCKTRCGVVKRRRRPTADGQTRMWLVGRFLLGSRLQQVHRAKFNFWGQ